MGKLNELKHNHQALSSTQHILQWRNFGGVVRFPVIRSVDVSALMSQLGIRLVQAFFDQFVIRHRVKGNDHPLPARDHRLMPGVRGESTPTASATVLAGGRS